MDTNTLAAPAAADIVLCLPVLSFHLSFFRIRTHSCFVLWLPVIALVTAGRDHYILHVLLFICFFARMNQVELYYISLHRFSSKNLT